MRLVAFHQSAFDDYSEWARIDKKLFERIRRIIIETANTPFDGIGKPEPLKHELKGYWSRRITDEHRLIYKVTADIKSPPNRSSSSLASIITNNRLPPVSNKTRIQI